MKHKRILALVLSVALLLSNAAFTPVQATQVAQDENTEATQTSQDNPSEEIKEPLIVNPDLFVHSDHTERLHVEEGNDLNKLVFRNEDGSKTMYIYDHPVKYRDELGQTHDISLEIADTENTAYPFRTKANSVVTSFPASLSDGITLSGNGVTLRLVAPPPTALTTLSHSARRVDKNTIAYTYDNQTTIEYALTYTGFKEDIVVSEYTGQTEYPFILYTNGLNLTEIDGSYYLTDEDGTVHASIGDIIVFTADERNNTLGTLQTTTIKPGQIYALTIVLDAEYLADPNTVYPIRIDPTVELVYTDENPNVIEERTIQSNNTQHGSNASVFIGYGASGINRLLMRFPGIDFDALEGVTVTSAVVSLRDLMCETEAMTVTCYPFTGTVWDESSSQWSNITQSWGTALDSHVISYDSGRQQESAHRYCFDITSLAQRWVDGLSDPAKGVIFRASASVESGPNILYKTFASSERSGYRPKFVITYQDAVAIVPDEADIDEGSSTTLTVHSLLGISGDVAWESSDEGIATVDSNGVVTGVKAGTATITATVTDIDGVEHKPTCTVYVTVPDGVYYIKNVSYAKCLANDDATVDSVSTHIEQKNTSSVTDPTQFWQITHLGDGWYSIRPVDRILAVLTADNSGNVVVRDLAENATIHTIYKWKIIQDSSGYIFLHKGLSSSAMTADAASEGSNVSLSVKSANPNCHWKLETAHGVVLRDTTTQRAIPSGTIITVELGDTVTLADLGIAWKYYCNRFDALSWSCDDNSIASVDLLSGYITAKNFGHAVVSIHTTLDGTTYSASYVVNVVLPSGTYFVKNKTTGMYADIDSQIMENGRIIHQWEFHGGNTQQWTFTHLGNGIYTIHSENSEDRYYLGVSEDSASVNQPIVLRTGTITDGMKWKVETTSSGAFKLTPNTGIANGCVLATSTSDATNGAALIQGLYLDNNSYRDEWYLRPIVYATSIGGEFHSGQDVKDAAENWKKCGYYSSYDINPSIDSLNFQALNSEIVYFSSHGNQHLLELHNDVFLTDRLMATLDNSVAISDFLLPNARLYIYDACLTASNKDETGSNLCTQTLEAGADCVIGWTEEIIASDAMLWQSRFQSKLIEGASIINAANYANTFLYVSNSTIKSWRIYGDQNIVVSQNNVVSPVVLSVDNGISMKYTNIEYAHHDETALKLILANEFSGFSDGDTSITITYTNTELTDFVIDYVYLHNGFITQSGYSVIVQGGIITQIRENIIANVATISTVSVSSSSASPEVTTEIINLAFAQAAAEVMAINATYSITEQQADRYYDIETGKYYYRIISVYITPQGTYGTTCTLYEL